MCRLKACTALLHHPEAYFLGFESPGQAGGYCSSPDASPNAAVMTAHAGMQLLLS